MAEAGSPASSVPLYQHRLDHLRAEGRRLRASLEVSPDGAATLAALGVWQRECAATIGQLSGGSKAHWLSRALSDAVLVPVEGAGSASVTIIVDRILDVLDRAGASLDAVLAAPDTTSDPPPRARFTLVDDEALRASLERAYLDGEAAFVRGAFTLALVTFASLLEAIITNALENRGLEHLRENDTPATPLATWPFDRRIALAEHTRLVSLGCRRLPDIARAYHALLDERGDIRADASVTSREAKLTRDVLHVVLRDLAPGR